MDEREYNISIGTYSYWITEGERHQYLTKRANPGVTHVALRDGRLILSSDFDVIAHISVMKDSEEIEREYQKKANANRHTKQEYAD